MVGQPPPGNEQPEAPYATPGHVLGILQRYRERSLPPVLSTETIEDALSISKVYAYRALDSLHYLRFLDNEHHPEPIFHSLRTLSDEEYKTALADQIRQAYPRLFQDLDPSTDDEKLLLDHFRRYDPPSQTTHQFRFFRSLCITAGLMEGKAAPAPQRNTGRSAKPPSRQSRLEDSGPTKNRRQPDAPLPPHLAPASNDEVRRLLAEALIEKISEVDAGDWETIQKYLDQINRLTESSK